MPAHSVSELRKTELSRPAPFQPQTESQLLSRIDHSLAQIKSGAYADAEEVENELLAEIDAFNHEPS